MTTIETVTVTADDLTVSRLLWRRFKEPRLGLVERVLELNPGLSLAGPIIPASTAVRIPIDPPAATPTTRPVVSLWD